MPALCHLTIDQEKKVRDEAFKLLGEFIEKVRRVSENSAVIDEIESELEVSYSNNNKFTNTAGAWASWAVSSFTSKLSLAKSSISKPDSKPDNKPTVAKAPFSLPSSSLPSTNLSSTNSNNGFKKLSQSTGQSTKSEERKSDASDYEAWDDADDRLSLTGKESRSMNLKCISSELDDLRMDDRQIRRSGWEIDDLNGFKDERNDLFAKDDDFSLAKGDSCRIDSVKSVQEKRTENDARIQSTSARSKAIGGVKTANKGKTLEDELFESLADPTVRKKRTGAMKLGAKRA